MAMMHRNKPVDTHRFAMTPRPEIPRSSFSMTKTHKTTFDAGILVPFYVDEILPGDTFNVRATLFARLATPIFPVMDNLYMDTFFFFVPNRLVWDNWVKMMGEQTNPGDSISFLTPQITSAVGGFGVGGIYDYMGLPTSGQVGAGNTLTVSNMWGRAYNLIYNQWFRDENLIASAPVDKGDGPDSALNYPPRRRGKRHDYFTSCLPWPQKGSAGISIPLGSSAPIYSTGIGISVNSLLTPGANSFVSSAAAAGSPLVHTAALGGAGTTTFGVAGAQVPSLYADLSLATAATINQLRQSFQVQKLLERDARGGTRYTEILRSHFGVQSPDGRLDRPEYLGGGSTPIICNPIAQTSGTGATGQTTPLGSLGAMGTALASNHGFNHSFVEHGMIIGLVSVRAELTYQQGVRKMFSRRSRYDYYWPVFAMLGEQAVLNKEIYADGSANDDGVFGYQERWAEYRYSPSQISGLFKSTSAGTIDAWHLAQRFTALPTLNQTFIEENPPLSRVLAVGAAANGQQIILDSFWDIKAARPLPLYSVPGMIDHF